MNTNKKSYSKRFNFCGIAMDEPRKVNDVTGKEFFVNVYSMQDSIKINKLLFQKMLNLSHAANAVLVDIIDRLEYNDVNTILEISKIATRLNYDRTTISKAVKELVDQEIIVRIVDTVSNKNKRLWSPKMYGLNTSLLYYGDNKFLYERANHIVEQEKHNFLLSFIDD